MYTILMLDQDNCWPITSNAANFTCIGVQQITALYMSQFFRGNNITEMLSQVGRKINRTAESPLFCSDALHFSGPRQLFVYLEYIASNLTSYKQIGLNN